MTLPYFFPPYFMENVKQRMSLYLRYGAQIRIEHTLPEYLDIRNGQKDPDGVCAFRTANGTLFVKPEDIIATEEFLSLDR
jgi:hypothetical protein